MTLDREEIASWSVSIGVHALLFLIMLFWIVQQSVILLPMEVQLLFADAHTKPVTRPHAAPPVRTDPTARTAQAATRTLSRVPSQQADARKQSASAPRIPAASQQGRSAPAVPPAQARTQNPVEFLDRGSDKPRITHSPSPSASPRTGTREELAGTGSSRDRTGSAITQRPAGSGETPSISGTPSSAATISWADGVARNRIAGVLPVFPPDVHREATITVTFLVHPNGSIHGITFLQKGEPKFEQAVLAAMRTWKFNTLASAVPQEDQEGKAAFTFRLK